MCVEKKSTPVPFALIFIENLKFVLLAYVCGVLMLTGYAQAADEPLPPEVKKLIGAKIAFDPERGGKVPGWNMLGSYSFAGIEELGIEEMYNENMSIFAVISINKAGSSKMILDAKILPQQALSYSIKNGNIIPRKNRNALYLNNSCKRTASELIVGLMRPEPEMEKGNCTHWSKDVKRAWNIDQKTGRLTEISPQGVSCYWETELLCLSDQN